jgi:site-specific DNA recombinase
MNPVQVALYARVSSDQQAEAQTIASQIADLHTRIRADGFATDQVQPFVDDGWSGATLLRPALEQLRDQMVAGAIDVLYVHCPDRLARKYAYQALLLEEFARAGVEVRFLNREVGATPEDQLLLQVQGMIAEYERAKFLERSRRGKRYAAQAGRVSVFSQAPYGYRLVHADEAGGTARFDIQLEEARVVRQIFTWVVQERCTLQEVGRRLEAAGVLTRTGKVHWNHRTIWDMLQNPAYAGRAAFGRTRSVPLQPRLRAPRGRPAQSRRGYSPRLVPEAEWITMPVPPLVDEATFAAAQEQLAENRRRARIPLKGSRYLLQGLLVCAQCGYAFYGRTNDARNAYYRCSGSDAARWGGTRRCTNGELRMDSLDHAVWTEVCQLLREPQRLEQEYRQRLQPPAVAGEAAPLAAQVHKLQRGCARLIDGYTDGLIEKADFESRMTHLRGRIQMLEQQMQQLGDLEQAERELRLLVGRFDLFAQQVRQGLDQADWATRRTIIRALVKRVEIDQDQVRLVFRVHPTSSPAPPGADHTSLHHLVEREHPGRLQRHVLHAPLGQPARQRFQVPRHRTKGPHLLGGLTLGRAG